MPKLDELLEIHKQLLDYYLHEHTLSWQLIGIGWAANVGLLSALLLEFSLEGPKVLLEVGLCVIGSVINLGFWLALERNQVYKDSIAGEARRIESELDQINLHLPIFTIRETIRNKQQHPVSQAKLRPWQRFASTSMSRKFFLALFILWIPVLIISLLALA